MPFTKLVIIKALVLTVIALPVWCKAELNFEQIVQQLEKSVVRVEVTKGNLMSVGTGFVWREPDSIVTSLHVMKPGPGVNIIVDFNGYRRQAEVRSVLHQADLVLLKILRSDPSLDLPSWEPIDTYDVRAEFNEDLVALGFHGNAPARRSRSLKRGHIEGNTLEALVPSDYLDDIKATGIPDVHLEIIYLDAGALLPGCSGAPIVNRHGKLVGIGDGGLEGGLGSVSWGIPAVNLEPLWDGNNSELPPNLDKTKEHFASDAIAVTPQHLPGDSLAFNGCVFVPIKIRTLPKIQDQIHSQATLRREILDPANPKSPIMLFVWIAN